MSTDLFIEEPSFEMSFTTKVLGLRQYFEDESSSEHLNLEWSPASFLGLLFSVTLEPTTQGKGLGVFLNMSSDSEDLEYTRNSHISIHFTVTVSSLSGQKTYRRRDVAFTLEDMTIGYGWRKVLGVGDWEMLDMLKSEDGFSLKVNIQSPSKPTPSAPAVLDIVHRTIRQEETTDVRFIVFRRRSAEGKMTGRRELLADRAVITGYSGVLQNIMNNDKTSNLLAIVEEDAQGDEDLVETEYLDSDSDFEIEAGDRGDASEVPPKIPSSGGAHRARDKEDDRHHKRVKEENHEEEDECRKPMEVENDAEEYESDDGDGMLEIMVTGAASVSWEAFLYYLYTGFITFAPLSSSEGDETTRATFVQEFNERNPDRPPPCSPKSMYRLACEFKIPSLKALCLDDLRKKLTVKNVVREIFTAFTSRYEEVKAAEMGFLDDNWGEIQQSESFREAIRDITLNPSGHTAGILLEIFDTVGRVEEEDL